MPDLEPSPPAERTPLRLLDLHWGLSPGGVAKYSVLVNSVGHHAPIALRHVCILGRDWPSDESTLKTLGATRIWLRSRADLSWISKVRREIARFRPHLLLANGFNGYFVAFVANLGSRQPVPVVCLYHSPYYPFTILRRLAAPFFNGFAEYFLRRHALGIATVAQFTKQYLMSRGVASNNITVIHNGIEDACSPSGARLAVREEWGAGEGDIVIATASRLDPMKGLRHLVDAFARLATSHRGILLVILGQGPAEDKLKRQAEFLGLDGRVVFTGHRPDVEYCLAGMDIFALPSLAESHSIALLEAMRAGKAIIATDVGGNKESVRHEHEALLVPPADAQALANALERMISDSALRMTLGNAARHRFLDMFTVDVMVRQTADWLVKCGLRARSVP